MLYITPKLHCIIRNCANALQPTGIQQRRPNLIGWCMYGTIYHLALEIIWHSIPCKTTTSTQMEAHTCATKKNPSVSSHMCAKIKSNLHNRWTRITQTPHNALELKSTAVRQTKSRTDAHTFRRKKIYSMFVQLQANSLHFHVNSFEIDVDAWIQLNRSTTHSHTHIHTSQRCS